MKAWLERHPIFATCLTGLGAAMLVAGLFLLLVPLATLDRLWALGDGRLFLMLAVLVVGALAVAAFAGAMAAVTQRKDAPDEEDEQ